MGDTFKNTKNEELLERIGQLSRRFEVIKPMQVRWHSRNPEKKIESLHAIWQDVKELGVNINNRVLYIHVEQLQLNILDQISRLDRIMFKELRKEFKNNTLSANGDASLIGIRLFSIPSRTLERLHDWQKNNDEKRQSIN